MSWSDPSWKEAAREYHATRPRSRRLSKAEWEQWRRESGLDDDNTNSAEQRRHAFRSLGIGMHRNQLKRPMS
jgi:hypothetical protein